MREYQRYAIICMNKLEGTIQVGEGYVPRETYGDALEIPKKEKTKLEESEKC